MRNGQIHGGHQFVSADGIHAERKHDTLVERIVLEWETSDQVAPDSRYQQQRNPPRSGCPEQQRQSFQVQVAVSLRSQEIRKLGKVGGGPEACPPGGRRPRRVRSARDFPGARLDPCAVPELPRAVWRVPSLTPPNLSDDFVDRPDGAEPDVGVLHRGRPGTPKVFRSRHPLRSLGLCERGPPSVGGLL